MKAKIIKFLPPVLAGLLMLIVIFVMARNNNVFRLKAVKIYNNTFVSKEEIAALAQLDFSKELFEIDVKKMAARISTHPMIEKVSISRFYPSVLKIKIKEQQLLAGVAGSDVVGITAAGKLIFDYHPRALYDVPVITGIHFVQEGTHQKFPETPELLEQAVKVLRMIKKNDPILYSEISELNFNQRTGMVIFLRKGNLPVLIGNSNIVKKLNFLATVYYHFLETNKFNQIQTIDVRFNGQVVVKHKS